MMNFSGLVEAISQGNEAKTNTLIKELRPRLIGFLLVHMNADRDDAEDCAQQALLKSLEAIRSGNIRNVDRILSFLLTACRNNYLNLRKRNNNNPYEDHTNEFSQKPRQLISLLDKERQNLLEWCLSQLSEGYRTFIAFWFTHPNTDAKAVATHFDISTSNAWTRKHRVLKKLSECCQKKINI